MCEHHFTTIKRVTPPTEFSLCCSCCGLIVPNEHICLWEHVVVFGADRNERPQTKGWSWLCKESRKIVHDIPLGTDPNYAGLKCYK